MKKKLVLLFCILNYETKASELVDLLISGIQFLSKMYGKKLLFAIVIN